MNTEMFMSFLLEHNIPLAVSDNAGHLFRAMFPDSKIAQIYVYALVQYIVGEMKKEIVDLLQETPVCLAAGDSTDTNSVKLHSVVVSFFLIQSKIKYPLFFYLCWTAVTI